MNPQLQYTKITIITLTTGTSQRILILASVLRLIRSLSLLSLASGQSFVFVPYSRFFFSGKNKNAQMWIFLFFFTFKKKMHIWVHLTHLISIQCMSYDRINRIKYKADWWEELKISIYRHQRKNNEYSGLPSWWYYYIYGPLTVIKRISILCHPCSLIATVTMYHRHHFLFC